MLACQRHKLHRKQLARPDPTLRIALNNDEMLEGERRTHRDDHASAWFQLLQERRRDVARRRGDDGTAERP